MDGALTKEVCNQHTRPESGILTTQTFVPSPAPAGIRSTSRRKRPVQTNNPAPPKVLKWMPYGRRVCIEPVETPPSSAKVARKSVVVVPAAVTARPRPPSHALGPFFVLGVKESQQKEQREAKDVDAVGSAAGAFSGKAAHTDLGGSKASILGQDDGGVRTTAMNSDGGGNFSEAGGGEGGGGESEVSKVTGGSVGPNEYESVRDMVSTRSSKNKRIRCKEGVDASWNAVWVNASRYFVVVLTLARN